YRAPTGRKRHSLRRDAIQENGVPRRLFLGGGSISTIWPSRNSNVSPPHLMRFDAKAASQTAKWSRSRSGTNQSLRRYGSGKQGERQTVREEQAEKRRRTHQANRARPTDLVLPKTARGLRRVHRPDRLARKQNFSSCLVHAVADFIIIREEIGQ